ncbi:MAG: branched-chain amino acid transport system permease protein [Betaproteobacteria bacterium]|jgi:branched-chain amino acid transport system permease protein|nr:branched-chain amino acid transport system permease protein [Betaproteobacteria bacterium]
MILSFDLLFEAVLFGVLLGCFYAAVSIGLSVSFGLLDVPHVAHPALMVLGSYCTFVVASWGLDPILAGIVLMPVFFVLGVLIYRFYYETFEKRGTEAGVRGLAFFFGLAFIIEVGLILVFGVDQRIVQAPYIGSSLALGEYRLPYRMLVAFGVALVLTFTLSLYLSKTFTGRAIKAVAQDEQALRLMGANPVRIKQWAFGIATGVSALAGAMLIIVGPVEPALDRLYIGRTFCVVVLAGLGSMTGTLGAGLILGISESIVLMMFGASWAPAVAFGLLLVVLGVRPQGLFGR